MKIQRTTTTDTKVTLLVTLNSEELAGAEQVALIHMGKDKKIPGFRPGKAPVEVVKKHLDPQELQTHAMSDAVNRAVPEALKSEKLQALDRPEVEVKKFVPNQTLEFSLEVEILPEIKLGNYKKLITTAKPVVVAKKDIDEVVERMRQGFAQKKEVKRPVKLGDEVVMDFVGKDDAGKPFSGGSSKDYALVIGSNTFIPGFEEGLIGKKASEAATIPITFPKNYHAAHLAGSKVSFDVKISKVNEVTLPKIDDDFAKKCGPFKTVQELKNDIKKELQTQRQREAEEKQKDELVEQLVKVSKPPAPEILIRDHMKNIETDFTQNLAARGMTLQQYLDEKNWTREEWEKGDLHEAATRRVQSALVLSELSKVEKIEVSKDELEARHQQLLQQHTDPNMRLRLESPEARADLSNRVLTEKTLDRLLKLNITKQ